MPSCSAKGRRGFVLVMVLLVISLAAISLAGLARNSLLLASEYAEAQQDLQQRWGLISCQRAMLDRSDEIFERLTAIHNELENPPPEPASIAGAFTLGKFTFAVLLADEDAKANLNVLREQQPGLLFEATRPMSMSDLRMLSAATMQQQPLSSWGEQLDLVPRNRRGSVADALQQTTVDVTLWGGGKLNLRRASEEAIRLVTQIVLTSSQIGKLLKLREEGWDDTERLISQLGLKRKQRGALRRLIGDKSSCYSLWVQVESKQRLTRQLIIAKPGSGERYLTFTW